MFSDPEPRTTYWTWVALYSWDQETKVQTYQAATDRQHALALLWTG
jgi:hypothetical protein